MPLSPRCVQKERRLTGLHKDLEELLFSPDFKDAVGERGAGRRECAALQVCLSPAMGCCIWGWDGPDRRWLHVLPNTPCRPAGRPQQAHPVQVGGSCGLRTFTACLAGHASNRTGGTCFEQAARQM